MNKLALRISCLLCVIAPSWANAQKNIQSAFDAIINCKEARITETHNLEKDPETRLKTGQSDVYRFVLPASKINLIKNVISAFDKDSDMAFSINRGKTLPTESDIILAVGDGKDGVYINDPNTEFIYSLYLAPNSEDPQGIYRYAYGMNYKEEDGEIVGKLVVTYATTLNYRQQKDIERRQKILDNLSGNFISSQFSYTNTKATWFDTVMGCLQAMTQANSQTRIALASEVYKNIKRIKDYPDVTETDKDTVRMILQNMITEKKYSETVLHTLLNQCIVALD